MLRLSKIGRRSLLLVCLVVPLRRILTLLKLRKDIGIIVLKIDRMGDWLLAYRSIEEIYKLAAINKESAVTWVSSESSSIRQFTSRNFSFEVVQFAPKTPSERLKRILKLAWLLSRYRANRVICLRHGDHRMNDTILANIACREIIALEAVSKTDLNLQLSEARHAGIPYEIARHAEILRQIGIEIELRSLLPRLRLEKVEMQRGKFILAPFGSSRNRDLPIKTWADAFCEISSVVSVVEIWVGSEQSHIAKVLMESLRSAAPKIEVYIRFGSLHMFANAMRTAELVIAVETFAAHFATAFDLPLVGIIGGGHFGEFAPWRNSHKQKWIWMDMECSNCGWNCKLSSIECINRVSGSAIAEAALELIDERAV